MLPSSTYTTSSATFIVSQPVTNGNWWMTVISTSTSFLSITGATDTMRTSFGKVFSMKPKNTVHENVRSSIRRLASCVDSASPFSALALICFCSATASISARAIAASSAAIRSRSAVRVRDSDRTCCTETTATTIAITPTTAMTNDARRSL